MLSMGRNGGSPYEGIANIEPKKEGPLSKSIGRGFVLTHGNGFRCGRHIVQQNKKERGLARLIER